MSASTMFCAGDECVEVWPEGPLPTGWTVQNIEGRIEPCCATCTAFYAEQARSAKPCFGCWTPAKCPDRESRDGCPSDDAMGGA